MWGTGRGGAWAGHREGRGKGRGTGGAGPLTGELHGEAGLADEEVAVELQRERVEGAVDVPRQRRAAPLLQQHVALQGPVPHLQDVVVGLRVEHDEVEAAERAQLAKVTLRPCEDIEAHASTQAPGTGLTPPTRAFL